MSLLNPLFDPAREAALVTGAGNGIGRAIAHALVGEGMGTVFADVREDLVAAAVPLHPARVGRGVVETVSTGSNLDALRADLLAAARTSCTARSVSHEAAHGVAVTTERLWSGPAGEVDEALT